MAGGYARHGFAHDGEVLDMRYRRVSSNEYGFKIADGAGVSDQRLMANLAEASEPARMLERCG